MGRRAAARQASAVLAKVFRRWWAEIAAEPKAPPVRVRVWGVLGQPVIGVDRRHPSATRRSAFAART